MKPMTTEEATATGMRFSAVSLVSKQEILGRISDAMGSLALRRANDLGRSVVMPEDFLSLTMKDVVAAAMLPAKSPYEERSAQCPSQPPPGS